MFEKEAKERSKEIRSESWFKEGEYYSEGYCEGYEDGFYQGAEFGYNKGNEWHDLRKNPNDLPDTDRNVWVKRESEIECQIDNYYEDDKGWGIMFREGYCTDDVILWCELPVPPKESE